MRLQTNHPTQKMVNGLTAPDMKQNDNDFEDALYDFKIRMLELLSNAAPWIVMIVVIYIITLIAA